MTQETPLNKSGSSLAHRPRNDHVRQNLPRPGRTQLLFEFDMQRDILTREKESFDYFLPDAYPPSKQSLQDLKSIGIGDLHLDKRYTGGVVYAKTIESAIRAAAIQTIIEDQEGLAERLAIYNIDLKINAEEFLPEDIIIALKEPTLTSAASGGYTIRIDHPSDLMVLDPSVAGIPVKLLDGRSQTKKPAAECKQEGNSAYGARKYITAISAYTEGLSCCTKDDKDIKYDLFRNRAAANIFLGRYKQGQIDAESAIIPSGDPIEEKTKALNTKAYERAAIAACSLGKYKEASRLYALALYLSPDQKELQLAAEKVEERQQEESKGSYCFEKMSKSCSKKRNRLDHANFLGQTEIRDAGKHGRGLFAVRDFEAGELVTCEKALSVCFDSDPTSQSYTILDSKAKKRSTGTKPQLLFSVCSKLANDIDLAREYSKLYDGKTANQTPEEVDGVVAVDTFRALSILDHNSIGCPTVRSSSRESQIQLTREGYPSTGIWLRISYINHACNGNVMRSFIGDMMIIRATRKIAKDQEIFMPYLLPNVDNTATRSQIQQIWGFKCDCELCVAETSTTTSQRKQRVQSNEELKRLIGQNIGGLKMGPVEQIYLKTKQTYNEKRFEQRPRVALVSVGWVRCKIYHRDKAWVNLSQSASDLLRDLGYQIEISGENLQIDRQHCLTQQVGIDAALYASRGYDKQGKKEIGQWFQDFAKSLWMIMYGAEQGFEDKMEEVFES